MWRRLGLLPPKDPDNLLCFIRASPPLSPLTSPPPPSFFFPCYTTQSDKLVHIWFNAPRFCIHPSFRHAHTPMRIRSFHSYRTDNRTLEAPWLVINVIVDLEDSIICGDCDRLLPTVNTKTLSSSLKPPAKANSSSRMTVYIKPTAVSVRLLSGCVCALHAHVCVSAEVGGGGVWGRRTS